MLILARKEKERVYVPNIDMTITVVRISGDTVRLGIKAPEQLVILREEVEDQSQSVSMFTQLSQAQSESHALRNQLQAAQTGLTLLQKMIEQGRSTEEVQQTINALMGGIAVKVGENKPFSDVSALLVEDQPNEREMLASVLRMSGYNVSTSRSGEEALSFLDQTKKTPDVMLLDMGLPSMSGIDVVRLVRKNQRNSQMKIFVLSGQKRPQANPGYDHWFSKPIDPNSLIETLQHLKKVG